MEASEAQATEVPPESTEAPAEAAPAEDTQTPDVSEYMKTLDQRLGGIEERLPEAESEEPTDFYGQLAQEPEYEQQEGVEGQQQPEAEQDEMQVLRDLIHEEAQAIYEPHFRQQQLQAFVKEHPDAREPEVFDGIAAQITPLAERYGRDIYTDPALVEMAYKAYKAEAAAAAETPAEAVGREGSLETGAGPSAPGEASPEDDYKQRVFGARGSSVF